MNESDIYKDVSRRLYEMFSAQFSGVFKLLYLGAPSFFPPDDALPCLIVHKASGQVTMEMTGTDTLTETIIISLLYNEKADFNDPKGQFQNTTLRKIQTMVEARDPTTLEWKVGTIMEAIRTNFTIDESSLGNSPVINYNLTPMPDAPTILEATITLTVQSIIQVSGRS